MIDGFDLSSISGRTFILDIFRYYDHLCLFAFYVNVSVLQAESYFLKRHLVGEICNWVFFEFSLLCVFSFYNFADVVIVSHWSISVQIRNYFWSVFSPKAGKYGPEITPYLVTFHVVLVCTICFGCDFVSCCILVWICDWFVKIWVDVLKLSWHFSDSILIFLLMVDLIVDFLTKLLLPSGNLLLLCW